MQSSNCHIVVDRFFFPENLEVILAYLIFIVDYKILDRRGFTVHASKVMQSAFVTELYRSLGTLEALQSISRNMQIQSKLHFRLVLNWTSTSHRFDINYRLVTILVKLYRIL